MSTNPLTNDRGWWTRGFRLLLATRLVSQCGDGMTSAGIAWLVLLSPDAQRTPGAFAAVLALLLLPFSVVGPFAGIVLDRWSRRHVLVYGQVLRTAVVLAVAAVAAGTNTATPAAYTLVLVALGINRLLLAALSAGVPHTVSMRNLVEANATAPTAGTMATGLGLLIGIGVLATDASSAVVLVLASATYLAAAGLAARFAPASLGPDTGTRPPAVTEVFTDLVDAAHHLAIRRAASWALSRLGAFRIVFGAWTLWMFELTAGHFHDREASVVAIAAAVGYVASAVLTPLAARRWSLTRWLQALFVVLTVLLLGSALAGGSIAWAAQAFAFGIGGQSLKIQTDTVVQREIGESYLGRAFTLYDVMFNVCFVAGALLLALAYR